MKRYILDSYALISYFNGEEGAETVAGVFKKALENEAYVMVCLVNWGEMYYIALRDGGKEKAELYRLTLLEYPVEIVEINEEITIQAAQYKAFNKMSYADAFAAALAKIKKAELVTGDKKFKPLEKEIKIQWI
jgi:ribonuclease VapC